MSKGFEIEIKGLNELMGIAEKYPNISEKHINKAIAYSLSAIRRSAVENSPVGISSQGGMKSKWKIQMGRFAGKLSNIATAKDGGYPYPTAIEFGTKPFWPNYKAGSSLADWAKAKGISPYLVARSISRKGIKGQFFFKKSIEENQDRVQKSFDTAFTNLIKEL